MGSPESGFPWLSRMKLGNPTQRDHQYWGQNSGQAKAASYAVNGKFSKCASIWCTEHRRLYPTWSSSAGQQWPLPWGVGEIQRNRTRKLCFKHRMEKKTPSGYQPESQRIYMSTHQNSVAWNSLNFTWLQGFLRKNKIAHLWKSGTSFFFLLSFSSLDFEP